jgi:hypothetical protein
MTLTGTLFVQVFGRNMILLCLMMAGTAHLAGSFSFNSFHSRRVQRATGTSGQGFAQASSRVCVRKEDQAHGNEKGQPTTLPDIPEPTYDSISISIVDGERILPIHPKYAEQGPVGLENFMVSRLGGPTEEELTNENLIKIVRVECNDLEVRSSAVCGD